MLTALRALFWISLSGLLLALAGPLLAGGSSWDAAQPAALLGLLFTAAFGVASVAMAPARRRRALITTSSAFALLVMGLFGTITEVRAQDRLQSLRHRRQLWELDKMELADATAGTWTGFFSLIGAGSCVVVLVAAARGRSDDHAPVSSTRRPVWR